MKREYKGSVNGVALYNLGLSYKRLLEVFRLNILKRGFVDGTASYKEIAELMDILEDDLEERLALYDELDAYDSHTSDNVVFGAWGDECEDKAVDAMTFVNEDELPTPSLQISFPVHHFPKNNRLLPLKNCIDIVLHGMMTVIDTAIHRLGSPYEVSCSEISVLMISSVTGSTLTVVDSILDKVMPSIIRRFEEFLHGSMKGSCLKLMLMYPANLNQLLSEYERLPLGGRPKESLFMLSGNDMPLPDDDDMDNNPNHQPLPLLEVHDIY